MGEATEVALRVLAEKVGLPGRADVAGSLAHLSKRERATFCNDSWQEHNQRVRAHAVLTSSTVLGDYCRHADVLCALLSVQQC